MKVCPACRTDYGGGEVFCPVDATRLLTTSEMRVGAVNPEDPLVGAVLAGRYVVEKRIGEGGMGLVYRGTHRDIGKQIAIKVLRDDLSRRPEVVSRFRREARSASRIGHENIVDIFDFGETPGGASYFVMEFLEGEDLGHRLGRECTMEAEAACAIVMQCCRALAAAHAKGIVHRDIKPENIFLTKRDGVDDFVKIVDFGIAKMSDIETDGAPGRKLTKTGMIFGTPEYMSPEQAAGKDLDHRVDIYALGIILYECLAGRVPFEGDTFMGVLTQHMFAEVPAIHMVNAQARVSPELELVIRKALAKDPEERYRDTEELAEALRYALEGQLSPATARTAPVTEDGRHWLPVDEVPRRKMPRWVWAAGGVFCVTAAAWLGMGDAFGRPTEAETTPAATSTAPEALQSDPMPTRTEALGRYPGEPAVRVMRTENVAPEPPEDSTEAEPAAIESIEIDVASEPSGARIFLADGSEACSRTPCTIETTSGAKLALHARLGRRRGRAVLTPTGDEAVVIELKAPPRPRAKSRQAAPPTRASQAPVRASDLKVPEWAQ